MKTDKNKSLRATARDADKTLEVLFEILSAVTRTHNLDELYLAIHHSLGKILNVKNFYIALHHEDRDTISFPYFVDEKDDKPDEISNFSKTASVTGRVIKAKKPLIFFEQDMIDFEQDMIDSEQDMIDSEQDMIDSEQDMIDSGKSNDKKTAVGTVSKVWIGAPLSIRDRVIGVVAMQSFHSREDYQEEDLYLLHIISHHIALAIERKESDEKLADQRRILEKILESSPIGICLLENRVFKWVNTEMVAMFGYDSKDDIQHKEARIIYHSEEDFNKAGKIIHFDLQNQGKSDFDFTLKKKDGTPIKVHIVMTGSHPENPFYSTIVTFTDISLREEARKEKLKREKLQAVLEMAGAVCHEINQPLQAIVGYSSLCMEENATPELKNIKEQSIRIGEITKRLSNITHYKTIDYPGDTRIVDIWGAGDD